MKEAFDQNFINCKNQTCCSVLKRALTRDFHPLAHQTTSPGPPELRVKAFLNIKKIAIAGNIFNIDAIFLVANVKLECNKS
jgi:hypothetical protein